MGVSGTLVSLSGSSENGGDPWTCKAHSPPAYPHTVLLGFFFYFFFYFVFLFVFLEICLSGLPEGRRWARCVCVCVLPPSLTPLFGSCALLHLLTMSVWRSLCHLKGKTTASDRVAHEAMTFMSTFQVCVSGNWNLLLIKVRTNMTKIFIRKHLYFCINDWNLYTKVKQQVHFIYINFVFKENWN